MSDTVGNVVWFVIFIALVASIYYFIFLERRRGFEALASRSLQLQQAGVEIVYYLCSFGAAHRTGYLSGGIGVMWNPGLLAYEQDGALMIEYPWWNVMQPFRCHRPGTVNLSLCNEYQASRPEPGIFIEDQTYIVAGLNITNVIQLKQLWSIKDKALLESNRQVMVDHLSRMGFSFSNG